MCTLETRVHITNLTRSKICKLAPSFTIHYSQDFIKLTLSLTHSVFPGTFIFFFASLFTNLQFLFWNIGPWIGFQVPETDTIIWYALSTYKVICVHVLSSVQMFANLNDFTLKTKHIFALVFLKLSKICSKKASSQLSEQD